MSAELISYLPDEYGCVEILREIRWPAGVRCVRCGSRDVEGPQYEIAFLHVRGS